MKNYMSQRRFLRKGGITNALQYRIVKNAGLISLNGSLEFS